MIRGIIEKTVVLCMAAACVWTLAMYSRWENAHVTHGLRDSIRAMDHTVLACVPDATPVIRDSLIVYLGIENYFRPKVFREVEFLVAKIGTYLDLNPVRTIGLGQISFQTFSTSKEVHPLTPEVTRRKWIAELSNDCASISVLLDYLATSGPQCTSDDLTCRLSFTCFWHAGNGPKCLNEASYGPYVRAALALLIRLSDEADIKSSEEPPVQRNRRLQSSESRLLHFSY